MPHPHAVTERLDYETEMHPTSMFPEYIDTDRLALRRVHPDRIDVASLHDLFHDLDDPEDVFRLCSWSRHQSLQETRDYVRERVSLWEQGEKAEYALISHETGEYIGTGYMRFSERLTNCVFGLWLRKPYWGQGLSGERADAFLDVAFNHLGLNYIEVGCLAQNARSQEAIEDYLSRYGGSYVGTVPVDAKRYHNVETDVLMHHEYALTRGQFEAEDSGLTSTIPGVPVDEVDL